MELFSKMIFPMRKVWYRVSKRLGMRKTGLLKLHHDVRTCEYEDVHVLWELLKQNKSGRSRSFASGRRKAHSWKVFNWARHTPFCCYSV